MPDKIRTPAGLGAIMKMVEVYAVQDTFTSGLGQVDILPGGFARFVLYVERRYVEEGVVENQIVARIVMPLSAVPDAILKASTATATGVIESVKSLMPGVH
jgi:hypothetical protein